MAARWQTLGVSVELDCRRRAWLFGRKFRESVLVMRVSIVVFGDGGSWNRGSHGSIYMIVEGCSSHCRGLQSMSFHVFDFYGCS